MKIFVTNWVCYSDKRVNEQMKYRYGSVSDPQIRPFFALIYSKYKRKLKQILKSLNQV